MRYFVIIAIILLLAGRVVAALAPPTPAANVCDDPTQSSTTQLTDPAATRAAVAKQLGWVITPNLCGGFFFEPNTIRAIPNPPPIDTALTTIASSGVSTFASEGPSTLRGNVTVTQPGRSITADTVTLYRNAETGKITSIDLQGNISYREAGKMIVGESSHIDVTAKTLSVTQGAYRLDKPSPHGILHGWGLLKKAFHAANGSLTVDQGTYSTCSPTDPTWILSAKRLSLNKETGRGIARDAWLYSKGVPLLYTPYANFPIDKRRYSGFLYPSIQYDQDSGMIVNIPYYFNLAPNYDDTLTASPMSNRGLQMTNLFRYLTTHDEGSLLVSYLPNDREFANFQTVTPQQFPYNSTNAPYLNQLANDSNNRGAISLHDVSTWSDRWKGSLDLNYVTDDYYLQDFGTGVEAINTDQLLNQAEADYQDEHWQFLARAQGYQTLHVINDTFVQDQYERLPQLNLNASYPDEAYGLDYEFNSEWDNFQHVDDFFSGEPFPTGNRLHVNPQIKLPLVSSSAFLTPALGLDVTGYGIINNGVVNPSGTVTPDPGNPSLNLVRTLPIFDIDSGIYLDRNFSIGQHDYKQTLEPRVFYLFVPQTNQNDIPVFDTTLPTFSYGQLFLTNRFAGYDRIGDANQLSLGITSRFLDGFSGEDKLDASIGEILYFQKHNVCLYVDCSDDPTINDSVSPLTGLLTFHPNLKWTASASAAWDPNQGVWNNAAADLRYTPAPNYLFKVGYDYVIDGDVLSTADPDSSQNNLQRIDLGATLPITQHWNAIGDWNYNISHSHAQTYLYGVEYNSCCWAMRFIASRSLIGEDSNGITDYRNSVYLQFLFKGLGSIGNNDAGKMLLTTFPGYHDMFKG